MKKLKKSLSVLLTLVMLFTTLCFFPLDLGAVEADAAISGVKIVVPETIYLNPADTKVAQYYINNTANGSTSATSDTVAKVYVTYPGATFNSVTVSGNGASVTWSKALSGDMSSASGEATLAFTNALGLGSADLVEWKFTFTVGGETRVHYAYTVAYAPHRSVGAVSESRRSGTYNNEISSWITGINGIGGKDNWSPISSGRGSSTTQGIFKYDPLWNGLQGGSSATSDDYVTASTTEYYVEAKAPSGAEWTRAVGYLGYLTVDSSRYTNTNQIPNFQIGSDALRVQDGKKDSLGKYYAWYILGTASNTIGTDEDSTPSGWTQFVNKSEPQTTSRNPLVPSFEVSTINGKYIHVASQGYCTYLSSKNYANAYVSALFTTVDKSGLRSAVQTGTAYNENHYTSDTWASYKTALRAAALALGTPGSASTDTSALTSAEAGLHTTVYFDANGGTLGSSTPASLALQIGSANSLSFNNADIVGSFNATRTGYTFLGWSTEKGATTAPASFTIGFNDTVYAVWEANKYNVTFDNLISIPLWTARTPSKATVSDITGNGFTLTSDDGAGEGTYESHEFPVTEGKQYKVNMDFTGDGWDVYIFFRNDTTGGTGIEFKDDANRRYSSNNSTGVDRDNAVFTAPAGATKAAIRVDANGSNNAVKFSNIRVYEVGTVEDGVSYEAPITVTYDSTYANLPTPKRTGYEFKGWFDANGNQYVNSSKVSITDTLSLYSKWEIGTYTITFDTVGGTAVNPITGTYGTAVTKPAEPTKTGYLFMGWDKTIPDTIPGENMTVKATWSENSYAVFFDGNNYTGGTAPSQINTTYTNTVTLPECTYTKNGYTFVGWNTKQDGSGVTYSAGQSVSKLTDVRDGSVTLYAVWEETPYTITYVYDNGTGETKVIPFDIADTLVSLAAPEKAGYTFAGWKVTAAEGSWNMGDTVGEGVTVPAGVMFGNATLTAQWTVNQYTITFDTDGGSAVAPITQDFGTAITAPTEPTKTGYKFAGWENLPSTMPAENITVKALWTVDQFTVTYKLDNGEADVIQTYDFGAAVTAPSDPTKTGYTFDGWENLPETMPANNVTVTAKWTVNQYTITYNLDNGEAAVIQTYDFGAAVTAPEAPTKTGYDFAGWSSTIPGTMPATNLDVTATWTIKKFNVTFNFKNVDGTDATETLSGVEYGTAFSELDIPEYSAQYYVSTDGTNHYNFTGWENKVDTITEAVVFTAQYEAEEHELYEDIENTVAPDCENDGVKAVFCDCGYKHQEVDPAKGHNYQNVAGTNTATCTKDGTIDQRCNKPNCPHPTQQIVSKATGHVFGDVIAATVPDCTSTGNEAYKSCTVCNKFFAENAGEFSEDAEDSADAFTLEAAGHKTTLVPAVAPECEKDGNIAYYTCENCDLLFSDEAGENVITNIVDSMTGHSYGDLIDEVPATCTGKGTVAHYKCSACSKTFDEEKNEITNLEISANGHEYGELIAEVPATCVKEGIKAHYTCSVCNVNFDENKAVLDSLVIDIDSDNHDLRTVEAKAPTCTESGWNKYEECQREGCSYTTRVEIPKKDHNYVGEVTKEATCTDDGVMTYTCQNDTSHTYTEAIKAEGHKFTAATERVAPACTTTGMESYKTCSVCNKYFAADADAFSGTAYDNTDAFVIAKNGHSYVPVVTPPTCEDAGFTTYTCSACGDSYTADYVEKLGHTEGEAVVENNVPATCTDNGSYDEVVYCTVCKEELSRESKVNVASGHTEDVRQENNIGATCTTEGSYDNVTYCTVCKEVLKTEHVTGVTLPHTYTDKIVDADHLKSAATCTKYAVYYYDCKDCAANAKNDAEADKYTFELETTYDADNHVGTTTTADEDIVAGTCKTEKTWNEVTRCDDCKAIITSVPKTGEKDPSNHIGGTKVEKEDVVSGTCSSEETWNDVTYCLGCNKKTGEVVARTGEKNPANHSTTETVLKNDKEENCHETGYTGDMHCAACDAVVTEGTVIEINATKHDGDTEVRAENEVAGTCNAEKTWDDVTYCLGCNKKTGEVVARTGEKDPANHVGGTEIKKENVVAGTCIAEETWNDVTYCLGCNKKTGEVVARTGEKDPANHTGTPTKLINDVAATCYSEGYTGDTVYTCCDALYSKGTEIEKTAHTPAAEAEIENVVKATCTDDGSHEEVIYCTVDACKAVISRTTVTDKAPGHTPAEKVIENDVPATCTVDGSYDEVVYCSVCGFEISRTGKTHTAPGHKAGEPVNENIVKATCTEDGSYEVATYCTVCGEEITREYKTTDALGHTPEEAVIENEVKVTCTTDGSYDTVVYCGICGVEISRETTVEGAPGHKAGEVVYENVIPATETENGKRDEVTYCTVCGTELSRETVILKPVRIITFIMHDETIEIEAHTGDTLTPPTVKSYESADGFIHQFKRWDKEIAVVTGNATYTATYTEPCDYTEIDRLEETLNDILSGGLIDDATLNEYKDQIDDIKAKLEVINANRNTLDKDNQSDIDVVVGDLEELVDYIYPDVGSTLEIVGASTFYTGSILDLKAVKMPANAVISEVQWTSSDDNIVFCSNGKLFAIGIGTVTITAKRGILTATKTINVVEGGDVRAINFISMDKAHIIVEDYFTVFNAAGLYWSDANEIRFRVHVYQNFPYETYIVYINGVEAEADADGYYTVPANAGNVRVSIAGAVYKDDADGTGSSGKWSFWEWLLMIFRKIAALFGITL